MALNPEEIEILDDRAQKVGKKIGWRLRFVIAPNPEFVGIIAGPDNIFVVGPSRLADLAAYEVDLTLDELERGDRILFPDDDGDPRLSTQVRNA